MDSPRQRVVAGCPTAAGIRRRPRVGVLVAAAVTAAVTAAARWGARAAAAGLAIRPPKGARSVIPSPLPDHPGNVFACRANA